MGALGENLKVSSYHLTPVTISGREIYPGQIFLGSTVSTYCINLNVYTFIDVEYSRGTDLDGNQDHSRQIIYILNHYYPVTNEPSWLDENLRDAAVQLAIWHYSDELIIPSDDVAIFNAARNIIADTESNYLKTYALAFDDPLPAGCVGSEITIRARLTLGGSPVAGESVSFSVAGSNTPAPGSATTDSTGYATFEYTPTVTGTDIIEATVEDIVPSGVMWVSQGYQSLASAKKNPLSESDSLSVNSCGSIIVVKDAVPDDAQDFSFTITGPSGYSQTFSLDDDSDNALSKQNVLSSLTPGTYTITENNIPSGWQLTSAICSGGIQSTCSDTTNGKTVNLAAGETVTVMFTDSCVLPVTVTTNTPEVCTGTPSVSFTAATSSCAEATYHWYKVVGGVDSELTDSRFTGMMSSILTITNPIPGDSGTYKAVVTCTEGCSGFNSADFAVNSPPSVTVTTNTPEVCTGTPSVSFTAATSSCAEATYHWYKVVGGVDFRANR